MGVQVFKVLGFANHRGHEGTLQFALRPQLARQGKGGVGHPEHQFRLAGLRYEALFHLEPAVMSSAANYGAT